MDKKIIGEALTDKVCVATCPAGIGNRIKCIISSIEKCNGNIDNVYVYWRPKDDRDSNMWEFKKLFKSPLKEISKNELNTMKTNIDNIEINKSWKFKDLNFKYNKLPQSEKDIFLPYFKFLGTTKDISNTVSKFMNKYKKSFNKKEIIGMNIRKGSWDTLYDGRQYISTDDKFIKKINNLLKINPNYKFLLCTECEKTENKFKSIFGEDTIIHFHKKCRDRSSIESIKEAYVDLLLLSKCPIIIGTFLSTFTEVAWWIGGCVAQVYITGASDKEAVAKVWSRLPKEGEGIHKKIWRKIMILRERIGIYG